MFAFKMCPPVMPRDGAVVVPYPVVPEIAPMRILRSKSRGFTLVELMIVVAIIGVLASLAIFGVTKYLASAKSGEAKNTIGAIVRGATLAYDNERTPNEILPDGSQSATSSKSLCGSAGARVPTAAPAGKKYQPSTADGSDFKSGDTYNGWKCLKFEMTEAIYYAYHYEKGAGAITGTGATANGFAVTAIGDVNGNGTTSTFGRGADVRNGSVVVATQLYIDKEDELQPAGCAVHNTPLGSSFGTQRFVFCLASSRNSVTSRAHG